MTRLDQLARDYVAAEQASASRCCAECGQRFRIVTQYHVAKAVRFGLEEGVRLAALACILTDEQRESSSEIARGADKVRNHVLALLADIPTLI